MSKRDSNLERRDEGEPPRQFITPLVPIEAQVGMHVIGALQQRDTVAVLTTVIPGRDGGQNIVSMSLDQDLLDRVRDLLDAIDADELPRVPCVGFHCFLPERGESKGPPAPPPNRGIQDAS